MDIRPLPSKHPGAILCVLLVKIRRRKVRRLMVGSCGRDLVKRHVGRNIVVRHDVLHMARIFCRCPRGRSCVARVYPLPVVTIELVLIIGGHERLLVGRVSGRLVGISGIALIGITPVEIRRDVIGGYIGRYVVVCHDILHIPGVRLNVIAVILAVGVHPFVVVIVELELVIRRQACRVLAVRVLPSCIDHSRLRG